MRVLVTGALGFIGSHLSDRFLADGHQIYGVDNLTTGSRDNTPTHDNGIFWIGDIANRAPFYERANICKPELVIHCAASYSDPNFWHRDTETNTLGTINAVLVAKHHKAPLVYFQTALPSISSYAISKIAGEQYIVLSQIPALIFRLANVYGPRNFSGPIPTFWRKLTAGERCTVTDTQREFVYISDLVDLVTKAIDEGEFGKFDVCSGHKHTIKEVYDHVREATGSDLQAEPDHGSTRGTSLRRDG